MSRKLSDDEEELWKQVTSDVRTQKRKCHVPTPKIQKPEETPVTKTPSVKKERPVKSSASKAGEAPLILGNYAGVDSATVRRIKRGQLAVSARIDLHGMTQAEAYPVLEVFLQQCIGANKRLVLVVTGKGYRSESCEAGVLKSMLPKWLNSAHLRPHILAFDTAQIQHGGSGAFYILLRRNQL